MCKCNQIPTMKFKLAHKHAELPKKANNDDACYDLKSVANMTILPGQTALVDTGLQLEMPYGWEAQVRCRSGLALKRGIRLGNGVGTVDAGYRNNIGIILHNTSDEPFVINIGDRIAQLKFEKVHDVKIEAVTELSNTDRGQGGFGSTGVK